MWPAAERWASLLAAWALPERVLAAAPVSPYGCDVAPFSVDDTLDRDTVSARWAREVLPPSGATVLDVGCGGGRASFALAPPANQVTGVDADQRMLDAFVTGAQVTGVARRSLLGRWPEIAPLAPVADVVVCHHVLYNVADVVPFVLALTDRARLAVVAEITVRHPMSAWNEAWAHFWGIDRPDGPTDADLLAVLRELALDPEHRRSPRPPLSRASGDPSSLVPSARRRLCLPASRDGELADWLAAHPPAFVEEVATFRWAGTAET